MFESLRIKDFQRHRDLSVALDPLVTTFVGPSGAGKSSVLRALRFLCLNDLRGHSFVGRWGKAKYSFIRLAVAGKAVARRRGPDVNEYSLGGSKYRAFRTGVPQAVERLLNVGPENFQEQQDPPLFFTLSPAEVSRRLNGVINLGEIDRVLADADRAVRRAKSAKVADRQRLAQAKARRTSLEWAEKADAVLTAAEQAASLAQTLRQRVESWGKALFGVSRLAADRKRLSEGVSLGLIAVQAGQELLSRQNDVDRLAGLIDAHERLRAGGQAGTSPDLSAIADAHGRCRKLRDRVRKLSYFCLAENTTRYGLWHATAERESAEELLSKVKKEIGSCPLCGKPFAP